VSVAANKRLFERWLTLMNERRGRVSIKTKPTKFESGFISSALEQASEEQLLLMLEWAFNGTDPYAKMLQGKSAFGDSKPEEHLGIPTLFKDTRLDKRLDLGEQWHHREVVEPPADTDKWLQEVALPALDKLIDSPESYETGYEWWAEHMGRHEGGPTEDRPYIAALMALREFRARDKS
jgi:hypothetical protein